MTKRKPDFATWRHENLVRLAEEHWACIAELKAEVVQLKQERREAIDVYRKLMKEQRGNT